ncbi:alkaline phosphatase D family protein [Tautonia marina]|uniref:alkaline phosphatase D family protein n=1 Tax=Tautonia marina TaxID=2653855 RepID=UPI001260FC28|nr:alkaline phosphatase D family protein [Tautonia marina]
MSKSSVSRRSFLVDSAAATAALSALPRAGRAEDRPEAEFRSRWERVPDRVWPGAAFWSNPLQDWRIRGGRLECLRPATGRSLHLLTHDLADRPGTLRMSVRLGSLDGGPLAEATGSAGFSIGVRGPLGDYRNNLVHGSGFPAGLRTNGRLVLGDGSEAASDPVDLNVEEVELRLTIDPDQDGFRLTLSAIDPKDDRVLGTVERSGVPGASLVGNLALVSNFGPPRPAAQQASNPNAPPAGTWWFADWSVSGSKVEAHDDHRFGPILFNQYTLHGGTMKMSVQMPPLGPDDEPSVRLLIDRDGSWQPVAEGRIDPRSFLATFRVEGWDDQVDTPYRLSYVERFTDGSTREDSFDGLIRRDPVEAERLTVADISCNAHYAFPNEACVASVAKLDPDLIAFTGDQFYESTGGFGVERNDVDIALLDLLRKWYQHGWTWRDLTRDRPSIAIPDDHDVYHGNLWGEGGKKAPGNTSEAESKGGYKQMAEFVNVVHAIETAHHPDSPAEPGLQGITGYYGPLIYGGIGFAILADRQYKSGPDGKVPPTTSGRADHVVDPDFDPETADRPGLELLGDPQLRFLQEWADDWRGVDMKAVFSQTIFTAMATHHGQPDNRLIADYDTNGWPQTPRDEAVRALRRAFAFHLAGDQHLPAVVHYGIDAHRDAGVAFASPAVNNLYPRWFWPESPGENRPSGAPEELGDFRDSFDHPLTVLACANPKPERRPGVGVLEAETDKSAGFGVVRFHKADRTITVECWPLLADPTEPGTQFPGWPVTVSQLDNGGARAARAELPEVVVRGVDRPVVQVIDESTNEPIYGLRLAGSRWRPFTFTEGLYTIRVLDPESGRSVERRGLAARKGNDATIEITL